MLYRKSHYMVEAGVLTRNYVRLSTQQSGLIDVNELPQVRTEYDSVHQQLKLTVPTNWLPVQDITNDSMLNHVQAVSNPGMLFNYDAYYLKSYGGGQTLSVLLEPRLFSSYGYLTSTGTWQRKITYNDGSDDGYLRYDTYWRYSDEDHLISYQLGDFISDSLTWSNSVRMGGIRISRNFSIRPDLVTYPLLQYSGTTTVPSSVDLFINGYKASSSNLNPGPYTLTNVPYINGSGEATVVTTDALGRQVVTTIPFYVANSLLREGFSDFDASFGALRTNYGTKNADYSHGASSLIYRYGLTHSLTISGHTEAE
ncbi:fimbria/pilus outer membrane usher protein (plasmid) [Klebsiella sp. WOUb02]|uniref:fimbria/pilus outer membrane usher protein n=1 Tax=Klebsiella sp. WOUb02 TaxID=3161071 RepID=UPI003CF5496A